MGWIKNLLPEPDDIEYQEMMERAWEDEHFAWWKSQDEAIQKRTIVTDRDDLAYGTACEWNAVQSDWEPGMPVGYGSTEAEAIEDLQIQIGE